MLIRKLIIEAKDQNKRARQSFSLLCAFTIALISSFVLIKQKKKLPWQWAKLTWVPLVTSLALFLIIFAIIEFIILRINPHLLQKKDEDQLGEDEEITLVESESDIEEIEFEEKDQIIKKNQTPTQRMFIPMMVIASISVAFAHGSNDIGNAIGPFGVVYEFWRNGNYFSNLSVPWWIFLLAAISLVFGLATLGYRVIETVGENIVPLTYSKGYSAVLAASTTVLTATLLGIPISTTHTLIGSITGTSLTSKEDFNQIQWKTILKIFASWFVTFIVGGGVTLFLYMSLKAIFLV